MSYTHRAISTKHFALFIFGIVFAALVLNTFIFGLVNNNLFAIRDLENEIENSKLEVMELQSQLMFLDSTANLHKMGIRLGMQPMDYIVFLDVNNKEVIGKATKVKSSTASSKIYVGSYFDKDILKAPQSLPVDDGAYLYSKGLD